MPLYLVQYSYTSEAWQKLSKEPEKRVGEVAKVIEKLGGRIVDAWLSFGEYDVVAILELPDNVSAATVSVCVSVGGATKSFRTTPLLSIDEGIIAVKKAESVGYKPPTTY